MELMVATTNKGKLKEIRRLLADTGIQVKGLDEIPDLPEIVEDGDTFEANARKKALTVARHCGCLTLADDSGLVVEALQGEPGVYSARYAGPGASDSDNNQKLLAAMTGLPREQREAAFHCAMALCEPSGVCHIFQGRLQGLILEEPRGGGGFGYDPLFLVPEYGKALAELPLEIKNRISHRGEALRQTLAYLQQQ
ncbi:non-canonical purine NTP pyrophosphatase, RdgB/HAM1 family [Syntrophotalea acetylenivorans]|uniref:dITP/XTP pyrophosphatase n=1 Tax=Syntrophotalea acetylenivorans TaxID=1842532 RepID=A0A1L3GKL2_9BACT|nr:XTP/dITP diphosphatase [Syntrophotalea acetylenivorans]APG26487.1 non-canonical purine NTP pyrophosphatase, RdgB/HAM1 family [Syntrophotalea acetylenivorans]